MLVNNRKLLIINVVFLILFLIYHIWILPAFDVGNRSLNLNCLDVLSAYSPEYVNKLFNALGQDGLNRYKSFILIDFTYIVVYGILLTALLKLILNNSGRLGNYLKFGIWLPAILILSDIVENINTLILIHYFPEIDAGYVGFASLTTSFKWFAASGVIGCIICLIFYSAMRFLFWKFKVK
jgi:hypothetical protein